MIPVGAPPILAKARGAWGDTPEFPQACPDFLIGPGKRKIWDTPNTSSDPFEDMD
jgi:hypothetical protein